MDPLPLPPPPQANLGNNPHLPTSFPPPPPSNINTNSTNTASVQTSRPSSQLSQNSSSGYGSTRSQVVPFNKSPTNSNEISTSSSTSSTSSNCDQRPKQPLYSQFGSLRLPNRPPPRLDEEDEDDPGLDLIDAEVDSGGEDEQQPTPAPRGTKEPPSYMNMPPQPQYPLRAAHSVDAMQVWMKKPRKSKGLGENLERKRLKIR